MSKETIAWLNSMVLIGYQDKRGPAWHWDGASENHFPGAIPMQTVLDHLSMVKIERLPLTAEWASPSGETQTFPWKGKLANVNVAEGPLFGTVLGSFGEGSYQVHDYREFLVKNLGHLVNGADNLDISSVGLLRNGGQAWVEISIPDIFTIGGDNYFASILACTSVDGTLATVYKVTFTRVVCDNTLAAGLSGDGASYRRKHTTYSKFDMQDAQSALGLIQSAQDQFQVDMDTLLTDPVSSSRFDRFVDAFIQLPSLEGAKSSRGLTMAENKRDSFWHLWNHDARTAPLDGTAYKVAQVADVYGRWESIKHGDRAEAIWKDVVAGNNDYSSKALEVLATV